MQIEVWTGSIHNNLADINYNSNKEYTDDRKISLGAYFTTNNTLASMYGKGKPLKATLAFKKLLDLSNLSRFSADEFFDSIPLEIPEKVKGEIVGGYTQQIEGHFILERLLSKIDLIEELKKQGFDGISFIEAHSQVIVPFDRMNVKELYLESKKERDNKTSFDM